MVSFMVCLRHSALGKDLGLGVVVATKVPLAVGEGTGFHIKWECPPTPGKDEDGNEVQNVFGNQELMLLKKAGKQRTAGR